jgi:large subunit ribosomal protein L35
MAKKTKNKSHKGTLKRIRVSKTGKVKHKPAGGKHLRSGKTSERLRRLRKLTMLSSVDAKRFEKLLHRRLRGRNQARATLRRSPSPDERKALLKERWAAFDAELQKKGLLKKVK